MLHEEHQLWSKICEDFDTLLDQADIYDLAGQVQDLVERTRRENVSVWEWKELLDDLAERVSWADDYASLGDDPADPPPVFRRAPMAKKIDTGFGCPGGLCDRQVTGGLLDPAPWCGVLAREMTLLA